MKKKQSVKSTDRDDAGDYTVGQVSSSLFPDKHTAGALSSLFSSTSSANTLVFVPAPKTESKVSESTDVKGQGHIQKQKSKKTPKTLSAAEKKLQDRESALQNADDEGQTSAKKVKLKRADATDETTEEAWPVKHRKAVKNMAEERIKKKRTVFVGNLPPSCTKKMLLSLFKQAGAIESVRFRSVVQEDPTMSRKVAAIQRKVHPKKQNINAYIVFKEEETAAGALKWNGQEIQPGFHIRVDRVSQHSGHDHKRSIFVGNLPYDIMELPVREHFEDCGNVEAVRLVRDRESGMGKGFGYVLFESPDSVMLALKLDGSKLLDRNIRVKRSVKKEKEKKTPPGRPSRFKGSKQEIRNKTGGKNFKTNPGKKQTPASSFKGEMADPTAKRGKGLKKKFKHKNKKPNVHI
ncbi:RNA-binding protein 34 isoform X2 [Sinocyclocheilus grahami]|uniref:RRM domain-containing protein n=1 Tax=Sinocyclocheilus grahami TaxID=75366 RepID=A0A672N4V1_SINGR|nr:PREDICTED: RNA-binding protein 34 isoform X1 [Sinocyclocheilus grahami]XP_016105381.1 PREDICTED: RNA-binding protein 34 isoform X2 [Sinocyclocheilus grahami]